MIKEHESIEGFYEALTALFPPEAYDNKKIGGWEFTTIDAYYQIERWNETCGPFGYAWGVKTIGFHRATNEFTDNMYCKGVFWYLVKIKGGDTHKVEFDAVGHGSRNEGEKKSLTNLISKASSYTGMGMDVFKGQHQDDAYVDEGATRVKKNNPSNAETSNAKATTATTGHREKLSPLGIKNEFQSSLPPAVKGKAGLVDIGSIIAEIYGQPKEKILTMDQNQLNDLRFDIQKNRDKYITRVKELIK